MKFNLLQVQTKFTQSKEQSLIHAAAMIEAALKEQPDIDFIALPEMFACPYENAAFPVYAEEPGGYAYRFCSRLAKEHGVYLSAGSWPERIGAKIYNTAYVFDAKGRAIARHAKMHLFDIDIKGGQRFRESDTLAAGDQITVFDTQFGRMGLCICYDFRFPELARLMADKGAKLIFVPAAFNITTGPLHWELMFRSRAVDNQLFTVGTAPARDEAASYRSWGHSIAVSPWGKVLSQMEGSEAAAAVAIDLQEADEVRAQLPLLQHRRFDIYRLEELR